MNNMRRPKLPAEDIRSSRIIISLTSAEKTKIEADAKLDDRTTSAYARRLLLK